MNKYTEKGYVLFTSLMFLLVLAVIGVTAMQTTNLDFRMSSNTAFHKQAFERSESGRAALSNDVLDEHLAQGGYWPTWLYTMVPSGLDIKDKDSDGDDDSLAINESLEAVDNPVVDAVYTLDFNNNSVTDAEDSVDISVFNLKTINAPGAGIGQASGYSGLGKGAGAGGTHVFFQVETTGKSAAAARSDLLVDFRHVNK